MIGVDVRDAEVIADLATADGRHAMVDQVTERSGGALHGVVAAAGVTHDDGALVTSINFFGGAGHTGGPASPARRPTRRQRGRGGVQLGHHPARALARPRDGMPRLATRPRPAPRPATASGRTAPASWRWPAGCDGAATADEWIGAGIRLNAVAPGFIDTPMTAGSRDFILGLGDVYPIPVGRAGRAEEVAGLIAYLLSDDAGFFCGSVLTMDGGTDAALRPDDWPTALP